MDSNSRKKTMRALRAGLLLSGIAILLAGSPLLPGRAVEGAGQQQQPHFTATVSGTITYCTNGSPGPVTSATVNMVGPSTNFAPVTNASGFYTQDVTESGIFNITPAPKTALTTGSGGIDAIDVLRARQIALLSPAFTPTVCQTKAADANSDTSVDALDVLSVRRFALGSDWRSGRLCSHRPGCHHAAAVLVCRTSRPRQDYRLLSHGGAGGLRGSLLAGCAAD